MTIVIPMAGLSSRFTKAGYTLPKYMLYVKNKSLFRLAVESFEKYFDTVRFVFIARDVFDTQRFIKEECELLGIKDFSVVMLDQPTRGQAETVIKGIEGAGVKDDESILIFNIDTFRPCFTFPEDIKDWDGYLEVFEGSGANWSYAKTESENSTRVVETAEKREISTHCSTGIYYFKQAKEFVDAYNENLVNPIKGVPELYVAPLYNFLIRDGKNIHINIIPRDAVIFCGIPQEYEEQLKEAVIC